MSRRTVLALVLAVVVTLAGALVIRGKATTAPLPADHGHGHPVATSTCTGAETLDLACRTAEFTALAESAGAEMALARLAEQRVDDGFLRSACHAIVHHLGHAAGERYGTVAAAYPHGTAMCSGGYYHGVTEAVMVRAGAPAADTACAEVAAAAPRSLQHLWCAHGMGHGYLDLADGDVFAALSACDTLATWDAEQCYGGVFMENVMSLADAAGPSRFLRAEDPLHPCPAVADHQKTKCYEKQTGFALFRHNGEFAPVFAQCAAAPDVAFRPACYQGLGDHAVVRYEKLLITEQDKAAAVGQVCGLGPDAAARAECLVGAVRTIVRHGIGDGIAVGLCAAAEPGMRQRCGQTQIDAVREYRGGP